MPLHSNLVKAIEAGPYGDLTLLITELSRPFTSNGFGNWFRKRCNVANLQYCSAHSLRKAAAAWFADRVATSIRLWPSLTHCVERGYPLHQSGAPESACKERHEADGSSCRRQRRLTKNRTKVSNFFKWCELLRHLRVENLRKSI
jgi:hypothetical protein